MKLNKKAQTTTTLVIGMVIVIILVLAIVYLTSPEKSFGSKTLAEDNGLIVINQEQYQEQTKQAEYIRHSNKYKHDYEREFKKTKRDYWDRNYYDRDYWDDWDEDCSAMNWEEECYMERWEGVWRGWEY